MIARVLLAICCCASAWAQGGGPPVRLAVHLVISCSAQGAGPAVRSPGVDTPICLDQTPFLTEKDVQGAEMHINSKGHPTVFLTFHDAAAMRELDITRKNVGNRVAILINGRVVSAPAVASSSRLLFIDGNFTEKQAQSLAESFNKTAGIR
jgi:preprotein translocase subunit SecD